jgi:hypothetical protein
MHWPWHREHEQLEEDRSYREDHVEKVITRVDALTVDLQNLVKELDDISRRFPRVSDS